MQTNRTIDQRAPHVEQRGRELRWDDMTREGNKRVAKVLSFVLGLTTTFCLTCCT